VREWADEPLERSYRPTQASCLLKFHSVFLNCFQRKKILFNPEKEEAEFFNISRKWRIKLEMKISKIWKK
jgi:hypothetical protein